MQGKNLVRGLLLGALAVTALAAVGCAGEALRFNNSIAESSKRLEAPSKRFGEAIAPAVAGGNVNVAEVKAAYNDLVNIFEQVKKDFASLKVPPGASAKKLADSYGKLLQNQEDMIRDQMGQIVKMVEAGRPAPGQLLKILQTVTAREQADLQELHAAQREFARDHKITLRKAP
jgi:hypothetical protein